MIGVSDGSPGWARRCSAGYPPVAKTGKGLGKTFFKVASAPDAGIGDVNDEG